MAVFGEGVSGMMSYSVGHHELVFTTARDAQQERQKINKYVLLNSGHYISTVNVTL